MSGIIKFFFKLFAYLLLVLVVFIASVTGIFIATFDANGYKQELTDLVREKTGRDLQFYGDVGLTFYPALGMKLGALSLSNAKGFGGEPMVKVNQVSISVDVASIVAFSPEIDQLLLRDLDINLQKNSAGVTNWDDLVPAGSPSDQTESTTPEVSDSIQPPKLRGAFGGLNIQNARLLWKDKQAGVEYRVSDLDLKTGRITPDAAFPLQLHVAVQSSGEIDANLYLNSQIQYLLGSNQLKLNNLDLKLDAKGSSIPFDPLVAGVSTASLSFDPATRSIDLKGLVLALNNLRLMGDITVHDYSQSAISFELAADTLNLDELLGTAPPGSRLETDAEPQPVETGSAEDVEIKLPMELIRSLNIDGNLTIAKLKLQNLWMEHIKLGMNAKGGVIDIMPLQMSLYDGGFDGAVQIDVKGIVPKYQVRKKLTAVQVGKMLADFTGEDKISGAMTASVNVNSEGVWLSEIKKNSNGDMSLAFSDGALNGFNLRYLLDKAKAKISGKNPPVELAKKTDFSALSLTGKITGGVFSSDDLNLQAPVLRVGGKGQVNLNNDTLDYLVNAKLVGTLQGQQGSTRDQLSGLLIPVRIEGPFTKPNIDVQLDEMLKAKGDAKIAAEKAKLKAKLDIQKAALKAKIAEEKAALEAVKLKTIEKQKAVLEARKKAAKEKATAKVKDKLKKLLE